MLLSQNDLKRLEFLSLTFQKMFHGRLQGRHRATRLGEGMEFAEHRKYFPGDDHRNIDWNIFARYSELLVKTYQEERDLQVTIFLDCSKSMSLMTEQKGKVEQQSKFDLARKIAAALSYVTLNHFDSVTMIPLIEPTAIEPTAKSTISTPTVKQIQANRKDQILDVMSFLNQIPCEGGATQYSKAIKRYLNQDHHAGVVFLISDFYCRDTTDWQKSIDQLMFRHNEVHCIQLYDAPLLASPYHAELGAGEVELVDVETGQSTIVSSLVQAEAIAEQQLKEFLFSVKKACLSRGITCTQANSQTPYEEVVLEIFRGE